MNDSNRALVEDFLEMVRIDSESGSEQRFISYLKAFLEEQLQVPALIDSFGNLICHVPPKNSDAAPLLLAAHADTVSPGVGIDPVIDSGVIRSRGETILGADDKAGIAEVIAALKVVSRCPPVDLVIVRSEEIGLQGAKNLDYSLVRATRGVLMDSDVLDTVVTGGPSHFIIDIEVTGKAAHAGMEPEKGVSAIRTAAMAFADFPEGRVDDETTANVGSFVGGTVRNAVPERVVLRAECRSLDHHKAEKLCSTITNAFRDAAARSGAKVDLGAELITRTFSLDRGAQMVRSAMAAIEAAGLPAKARVITGGTDASVYNEKGIETVVLGIGVKDEHTVDESIAIADMERAVQILKTLLESSA